MIYILHQVNCQNAFGAGFAGYISRICPEAKEAYHRYPNKQLGNICQVTYKDFTIVHIFSQNKYGNSKHTGIRYTNYEAMEHAFAKFRSFHPNDTAICPVNMGCGLAGGDWNIVSKLCHKYNITPSSNIDLSNYSK